MIWEGFDKQEHSIGQISKYIQSSSAGSKEMLIEQSRRDTGRVGRFGISGVNSWEHGSFKLQIGRSRRDTGRVGRLGYQESIRGSMVLLSCKSVGVGEIQVG
jgi:hypothetical protein